MKKTLLALLLLAPAAGFAADAAPEQLIKTCETCHGPGGAKPIAPNYPVIAGQHSNYLAHTLKDYRGGHRKNPVMAAQAAALSDADIDALARYFGSQPGPLYTPKLPERQ